MNHQQFLSLLRRILSTPTAPFHEYHVAAVLRDLLAPLPHVSVQSDSYGNLIARYKFGRSAPRIAFAAHMDHPGWVRYRGKEEFLGWVPEDRLASHPVDWFGPFGMWRLEPFELKDGIVHARVCDDLAGCAAIVALFMELEKAGDEADVFGLFTRAEEVGFNGAIALARDWPLPQDVRFVSIETSSPRNGASMGLGPIIRVGDRVSVFDDAATSELVDAAKESSIAHQRSLLDGGSCEATAMNLYGIPAAGISIALGNYHNVLPESGIGPEYINLSDAKNLVKLILAVTRRMALQDTPSSKEAMRQRLEKRWDEHQKYHRDAAKHWENPR